MTVNDLALPFSAFPVIDQSTSMPPISQVHELVQSSFFFPSGALGGFGSAEDHGQGQEWKDPTDHSAQRIDQEEP